MNINWRRTALGELETETGGVIQTGPFGSQLHMSDYSDEGTPVVMPTNIRDMRIDPTDIARVGDEHVDRLVRHQLRPGDILYSRRGDVEKCALVTEHETGWLCGTGCLLVRVQGEHIDTRFLAYQLSTPAKRGWIRQHAVGLTMLNLNTGILREIPIELPDFEQQRRIAGVLGALDDKIESNCAQQRIGEYLLRAVIEGILGQFSEADFISFDAYCTQSKESVRPENIGNGDKYIALEHMPRGSVFLNSWETAKLAGIASNKTRFRHGDLLFGKLRPYFKKVGVAPVSGVCSTDILVIRPRLPEFLPFIAVIASSDALIDSISASATGTRMPRASWKEIATWPVPQSPDETLTVLLHPANQLMAFLETLSLQNLKLAQLRDALLPELMSGRMRVDEAGRLVSETFGEEVR